MDINGRGIKKVLHLLMSMWWGGKGFSFSIIYVGLKEIKHKYIDQSWNILKGRSNMKCRYIWWEGEKFLNSKNYNHFYWNKVKEIFFKSQKSIGHQSRTMTMNFSSKEKYGGKLFNMKLSPLRVFLSFINFCNKSGSAFYAIFAKTWLTG